MTCIEIQSDLEAALGIGRSIMRWNMLLELYSMILDQKEK